MSAASKKAKKAIAGKNSTNPYSSTTDYNDQVALYRRAERFSREHELERTKQLRNGNHSFHSNNRSLNNSRSGSVPGGSDEPEGDPVCMFFVQLPFLTCMQNVMDWDRYTIVGTSQETFKDYLRLTSEPKPESIRPYPILQRTLTELKKRWKNKESFGTSYNWICNQLKSLRQDLTVCRKKYLTVLEITVFSGTTNQE